jgi:hypothetical protein
MQQRRSVSLGRHRYHRALTAKSSRLFERTPLTPSDSLDEIALQIPRCLPACLSVSFLSANAFMATLRRIQARITEWFQLLSYNTEQGNRKVPFCMLIMNNVRNLWSYKIMQNNFRQIIHSTA